MKKTTWGLASLTAAALFGLATLGTGTAYAAATYCSDNAPTDTNAAGLSTSDVTFRGNNADDCYGIVLKDELHNPDLDELNGINLFGGDWDVLVRDEGASAQISYLGLLWTLDAPQNVSSGNWTLTVVDGPAPGGFPVTIDIAAVFKASTEWVAYLFTAELFSVAGPNPGTFELKITNNHGVPQGLSHMDLLFREAPTTTVGEPATLLLLGAGVAAAASGRRLQRRRVGQVA